jgi:hypothetical protein
VLHSNAAIKALNTLQAFVADSLGMVEKPAQISESRIFVHGLNAR